MQRADIYGLNRLNELLYKRLLISARTTIKIGHGRTSSPWYRPTVHIPIELSRGYVPSSSHSTVHDWPAWQVVSFDGAVTYVGCMGNPWTGWSAQLNCMLASIRNQPPLTYSSAKQKGINMVRATSTKVGRKVGIMKGIAWRPESKKRAV